VPIGGDAPITVQSMTNTKTEDIAATVHQILQLEEAGCELVRVTVPNETAAQAIKEIKRQIHIPLIADIHFNYRMALLALGNGVDKIRINPGNIGSPQRIKAVLEKAKERNVPLRIGVNAGSLEKTLLDKYGKVCAEALVESALRHVEICQDFGFDDIVISIKAAQVPMMIDSYRMIAEKVDFPLHLGVTEAGTTRTGSIKSAIGIGTLLAEGIGDTIRVSLTDNPIEEIKVGFEILKALNLRKHGINIVACPTCGRLEVDLISIVNRVEKELARFQNKSLTVAIMGCVVNGPGEAREADIGVACGKHSAMMFKKGQIVGKIKESQIVDFLIREIENWPNYDSETN
ncbi:MAG TPA: flavodoxin-dependent (E)-4-hydroxy-3-methylbut-2-enyl-diphosphate synthase, partial [Bacteroidetes bacterium]|nr:flavodoxin-dependent (E)-4-hydroxy-3-methylbut-2-enyl-diphosphate synthase [Bacteroidota bacterium]